MSQVEDHGRGRKLGFEEGTALACALDLKPADLLTSRPEPYQAQELTEAEEIQLERLLQRKGLRRCK